MYSPRVFGPIEFDFQSVCATEGKFGDILDWPITAPLDREATCTRPALDRKRDHINLRRLNAAMSFGVSSNHSPFRRRSPNRVCQ